MLLMSRRSLQACLLGFTMMSCEQGLSPDEVGVQNGQLEEASEALIERTHVATIFPHDSVRVEFYKTNDHAIEMVEYFGDRVPKSYLAASAHASALEVYMAYSKGRAVAPAALRDAHAELARQGFFPNEPRRLADMAAHRSDETEFYVEIGSSCSTGAAWSTFWQSQTPINPGFVGTRNTSWVTGQSDFMPHFLDQMKSNPAHYVQSAMCVGYGTAAVRIGYCTTADCNPSDGTAILVHSTVTAGPGAEPDKMVRYTHQGTPARRATVFLDQWAQNTPDKGRSYCTTGTACGMATFSKSPIYVP